MVCDSDSEAADSDTTHTDTDTEEDEEEEDGNILNLFSDTPVDAEPAATVTRTSLPGLFRTAAAETATTTDNTTTTTTAKKQQQQPQKKRISHPVNHRLPYQPRQRCDQAHPCQHCVCRRLQNKRESIKVRRMDASGNTTNIDCVCVYVCVCPYCLLPNRS